MDRADAFAEELGELEIEKLWEMLDNPAYSSAQRNLIVRELEDFRGESVPTERDKNIKLPCSHCGSIDTEENRNHLWDLYHRLDDGGRKHIEPLVYTSADFEDMGYYGGPLDDDDFDAVKLSMERNMQERGLCPECGLPDLRGTTPADYMTEAEANDLADMYAEMAAERRAGC